jgi:alpha-glucosidase
VRVERATGCLCVLAPDGRSVLDDADAPGWTAEHAVLSKRLRDGERVLGLGDKTTALDRRGGRYAHWNTDAFAFERGTDPIYKTIPFVLGIGEDGLSYGLFVDAPARSSFDVGAADPERLTVEAEAGELTYYVFYDPSPLAIVQAFTRLTGPMPMLPKWALGYHQCRYSYRSADEVRAVARGFRERGIPCDALYFDIHYMDGYRVFTWDRDAFPDPAGLIRELKEDGFHSVVIVDPGVKADDPDYAVARDGLKQNVFCRMPDGAPYVGDVWPGPCYFPDFTDPAARRWWGELHRDLLDAGVDGVWNDMNEPAIFDVEQEGAADVEENAKTFPDDVRHHYEGRGADHALAHNVYGMQMVRATYDGLKALRPDRRPFVITRAAYAGTQRYATGWTGDNSSTWDHLRLALQQALSLNVSGMAFVGADVGGFIGAPSGELLARWTQLGALMPLFRNHSGLDTPPQEPWAFGPEVERVCRDAIELRYRLLPYLYTQMHRAAEEALPILRPLALVHPDDETIRQLSPDGFYVGPDLLAYPALHEGQREVGVYFPPNPGGWFDFHTGAHYEAGATHRVAAPLGTLPLFVRAGTVLPLGPVRASTSVPAPELTLRVYPGTGAFDATWYDDDGDGWGYAEGDRRHVTFRVAHARDGLRVRVEERGGGEREVVRYRVEVIGLAAAPRAVMAEGGALGFESGSGTVRFQMPRLGTFSVEL